MIISKKLLKDTYSLAVDTSGSGVSGKPWLFCFLVCDLGQVIRPLSASVKTVPSCSWVCS